MIPRTIGREALAQQESLVKDLTDQCRSFHGQIADLQQEIDRLKPFEDAIEKLDKLLCKWNLNEVQDFILEEMFSKGKTLMEAIQKAREGK